VVAVIGVTGGLVPLAAGIGGVCLTAPLRALMRAAKRRLRRRVVRPMIKRHRPCELAVRRRVSGGAALR